MTLEGTVVNGVIVLDGGARLPEGERVRVEVADPDDLAPPALGQARSNCPGGQNSRVRRAARRQPAGGSE